MLEAVEIVLIVLGALLLAIALALLVAVGAYLRKRNARAKQRQTIYSVPTSPSLGHAGTDSKDFRSEQQDVPQFAHSDFRYKDDETLKRPSHIDIPIERGEEVQDETAGQALAYDTNIRIEEFCDRVAEYHAASDSVFHDEFEMLNKNGLAAMDRPRLNADQGDNLKRNRFLDVLPFDENRVKLRQMDSSDYINASFIDGSKLRRQFIATQGPLGDSEASVTSGRRMATVDDFWAMVWEHEVSTIIMLTQCVENCRPKCARYWPAQVGEATVFGDIEVDLVSTSEDPTCLHREFDVRHGSCTREISQYHFKEWEDARAAESVEHLLDFVERIRKTRQKRIPLLVHCSAGVGRTGVFIALFNLLEQLASPTTTHVDVFATVARLREQRVRMVQTAEQYVSLYDTLAAAIRLRLQKRTAEMHDSDTTESLHSEDSIQCF